MVLLLFLLADLPAVLGLTDADNRLFVAVVPYLLVLTGGYLAIHRSIPADRLFLSTIAVTALLYVTSFFNPISGHPIGRPHVTEWMVQRTGFVVTLVLLFLAYALIQSNPPARNRALLDRFVTIAVVIIVVAFAVYIAGNITPFLPARVISYGDQDLSFFGLTWSRFGATLKEPFEFALLCTFLVTYLISKRRFVEAGTVAFIGIFSFSNFLSVGYLFAFSVAIAVSVVPHVVVGGIAVAFVATGVVLFLLGPGAAVFSFLELIIPRSYSLLSVRPEAVQRLWSNVIAVREFTQLDWPLGGNAGFLRAYTRDFYFYTVYKSNAAGAGVFRFLMDFGVFGIPVLFALAGRLHRRVVTALPGKQLAAKVLILLCVFIMCVRTGYLNVSIWTMILLLYYGYLAPGATGASSGSTIRGGMRQSTDTAQHTARVAVAGADQLLVPSEAEREVKPRLRHA